MLTLRQKGIHPHILYSRLAAACMPDGLHPDAQPVCLSLHRLPRASLRRQVPGNAQHFPGAQGSCLHKAQPSCIFI
jgi:hypothetical protein